MALKTNLTHLTQVECLLHTQMTIYPCLAFIWTCMKVTNFFKHRHQRKKLLKPLRVCVHMTFLSGRKALAERSAMIGWRACALKEVRLVAMTTISWQGPLYVRHCSAAFTVCFLSETFFYCMSITQRILSLIPCLDDELHNDMDPLSRL